MMGGRGCMVGPLSGPTRTVKYARAPWGIAGARAASVDEDAFERCASLVDAGWVDGANAKDSMSLSHASAHLAGSNSSRRIFIFPQLSQPAGITIRSLSSALAGCVNLNGLRAGAGMSVLPIAG
jgi:hypothetical protein